MERKIEFVVQIACREGFFGNVDEVVDRNRHAKFFHQFSFERDCGGFAELNVAAWKEVVFVLDVLAKEDAVTMCEEGAGNAFD